MLSIRSIQNSFCAFSKNTSPVFFNSVFLFFLIFYSILSQTVAESKKTQLFPCRALLYDSRTIVQEGCWSVLGSGVISVYKRERAMIGKAIARSIPPIAARISAHTQSAPNAANARKINNNVTMLDSFGLLSDVFVKLTPTESFVSYISS